MSDIVCLRLAMIMRDIQLLKLDLMVTIENKEQHFKDND